MATSVIMPRQGQSVESCIISSWEKKVGDQVKVGDILFSYETDKSSFEEEARVDGTLLAIFYEEHDDVPCLEEVAVIGEPGEDISAFGKKSGGAKAAPAAGSAAPAASAPAAAAPAASTASAGAGTAASPRAKMSAERMKVDLSTITPTGPNGRIIERDVLRDGRSGVAAAAAAPAAADTAAEGPGYHDEPTSNLRNIIAKAMYESLQSMAQLTHHSSFDATNMMSLRKQLKASAEKLELPNITYNDIILYAVSRVLKKHPVLNAHYFGDTIRYFDHVHLGMAVDTPRGLLVPTIFNADTKSLAEISKEAKELAALAQGGAINPDLLTGGTFTVSNLGSFGVEMFTPVINAPQTAILGVDCIVDRVRSKDGQISVYPAMGISLTYDHRALDGAPASRFLMDLKVAMENINAFLCG